MRQNMRKIVLAGLMVCFGVSLMACEETEFQDSAAVPGIFKYVDALNRIVVEHKNCTDLILEFDKASREETYSYACESYKTESKNTKEGEDKVQQLATMQLNSGFYMAAYILADEMHDTVMQCEGGNQKMAREKYESLFANCGDFLTHAKDITDKRFF